MSRTENKLQVPNPAAWIGRVWDRMPAPGGEPSLKAWAQAFGLGHNDARVLDAVGCFVDMGKRTQAAMEALRGLPNSVRNSLLGWTSAFEEIVHQTTANGAWSNIRVRFTDVRREQLRQCEQWLDEQLWTQEETRAYLDSLIRDIDAMKEEALNADVEEDFRRFLLDVLEALRRAVAEYEIRGSQGVFTSLGEILSLRSHYPIPEDANETSRNLLQKTWSITKKVAVVGSTVAGLTKAYEVAHDVYGFLTGP